MFAVDHAATALLIKRRFPSVSLTPILLAVQAMELAWVGLNYLGIERTTTEASVRSVADIHLAYMPFSHSVATAAGAALLAWLIAEKGLGRPLLGRAIGIGIISHLVLDVVTHARDIALWPGSTLPALGLGLYDRAPMWGFALEMAYGVICWRVYRGSRPLLAMIVLGNLTDITLFSAAIPGPEVYLAGHPLLVVTMVFLQIATTLPLVYVLATRGVPALSRWRPPGTTGRHGEVSSVATISLSATRLWTADDTRLAARRISSNFAPLRSKSRGRSPHVVEGRGISWCRPQEQPTYSPRSSEGFARA